MEWFDTHAHLNDEQFDEQIDLVLGRAVDANVSHTLVVGTNLKDSQRAIELAESYTTLHAAVGIQPNYVCEAQPADFDRITELARHPEVVAIGETGLDRYWDRAPIELQRNFFARHIQLAIDVKKPFVVHMRECGDDILNAFNDFQHTGPLSGVMHSFTGDESLARSCLDLGLHISFAGMLTYKKSDELRRVAASIPLNRLLIETDSPYLSPHPKRGQRPNEPALVVHTAECLAKLKNVSLPELADATSGNAKKLFGIS